jgi:hypothetical protein
MKYRSRLSHSTFFFSPQKHAHTERHFEHIRSISYEPFSTSGFFQAFTAWGLFINNTLLMKLKTSSTQSQADNWLPNI